MGNCKSCEWWVYEGTVIGDFDHRHAVAANKGFCVLRDLFTYTDPKFKCTAYRCEIGGNDEKRRS